MKEAKEIQGTRTEKMTAIRKPSNSETAKGNNGLGEQELLPPNVDTAMKTSPTSHMFDAQNAFIPNTAVAKTPLPGRTTISSPMPRKALPAQQAALKGGLPSVEALRERCRQIGFSLFFDPHNPVRSIGITSSITGEGKSFLASVMAGALSEGTSKPITLIECNWEHPTLHEQFAFPPMPGLAEWLRGECHEQDIRRQVSYNLTIIPAGNGKHDAVQLLQLIQQQGLPQLFSRSGELLIVDLPPMITAAYSVMAASMVESLLLVVRSGVTSELFIAEATEQLKGLPVQGVILNQIESRIPRWLRQLL